jgi:hypothetical protein
MFNSYDVSNYLIRFGMRSIFQMAVWLVLVFGFLIAWAFFPGVRNMLNVEPFPDAGPLELPEEIVLGEAPATITWCVDSANGGVLLAINSTGDPWNPVPVTQRIDPPWKECKPTSKDAQDPLEGTSPDGRLVARSVQGKNFSGKLRIVEKDSGKVLALIEPFSIVPSPKFVAWHPKSTFFVTAGGDQITVVGAPEWRPKILKTASRDFEAWQRNVQNGNEESGYHYNEMTSHILFNADGSQLICAMDQGIRIYSWDKVLKAEGELPPPEFAADGALVRLNSFVAFRMTYTAAFDKARNWVLWTGLEGKLEYVKTTTNERGTLLELPLGYEITRMEFLDAGKVLACEIHKLNSQSSDGQGLFFLDYAKLVERRPQP